MYCKAPLMFSFIYEPNEGAFMIYIWYNYTHASSSFSYLECICERVV